MKNFYLIYGVDRSIINNELNKVIKKLGYEDIVRYDMANSNLVDVIEDLESSGLFSSNKIIIMDDCYFLGANKSIDELERLEGYIEHYNPDNYCIMLAYMEKPDTRKKIYKLLKTNAEVIEQVKIDDKYLINYVSKKLQEDGYKMDDVNYFVNKIGINLYNADNELNKLMMYKLDSHVITNEDIDKVTIRSIEEEIFSLTDAVIMRDVKKSLKLLDEFLSKDYEEIQIIMLLASQFRFLFQVKRLLGKGKSEAEIARVLGANPYRVKFTVKKLYAYTEDMLLDYITRLAKMDHDIKLGLMDKRLALELFITMNK